MYPTTDKPKTHRTMDTKRKRTRTQKANFTLMDIRHERSRESVHSGWYVPIGRTQCAAPLFTRWRLPGPSITPCLHRRLTPEVDGGKLYSLKRLQSTGTEQGQYLSVGMVTIARTLLADERNNGTH